METLIDLSKAFGWLAAIIVNLLIAWIVWSLHKKFMNRDDCEANRKADKKERERFIQLLTTHEQAVRELNLRVDQMPPQGSVQMHSASGWGLSPWPSVAALQSSQTKPQGAPSAAGI